MLYRALGVFLQGGTTSQSSAHRTNSGFNALSSFGDFSTKIQWRSSTPTTKVPGFNALSSFGGFSTRRLSEHRERTDRSIRCFNALSSFGGFSTIHARIATTACCICPTASFNALTSFGDFAGSRCARPLQQFGHSPNCQATVRLPQCSDELWRFFYVGKGIEARPDP